MQRLLDQLNSRDKNLRAEALREARTLTPEELLQLVVLADNVRHTRRKRSDLVYYTVMGLYLLIGLMLPVPGDKWVGRFSLAGVMFSGTFKTWYVKKYSSAVINITTLLLETDDVRFAAPMLRLNHEHANESLRTALKNLLPQVRADHAAQWSKEDKAALLLPLKNPEQNCELTLTCLNALQQIGDSSAIPAVRRLIEKRSLLGHRKKLPLPRRNVCCIWKA